MPTLSDLRTAVRRKVDRVNAATPSDAELTEWINESAAELWDELVTCYEDQYTEYGVTDEPQASVFNVSSLTALFEPGLITTRPMKLFKLVDLQYSYNGEWTSLDAVPQKEWWKHRAGYTTAPVGYTLLGEDVHILPSDTPAQQYRLFYVAAYQDMVETTDELFVKKLTTTLSRPIPNRWDEFIVVDVAIKVREKFEEDASLEMARKAAILNRIRRAVSNRTIGMSRKIVERATHRDWSD